MTTSSDLVNRLLEFWGSDELGNGDFRLLHEAAARIIALEADKAALVEDLTEARDQLWHLAKDGNDNYLVKHISATLAKHGGE